MQVKSLKVPSRPCLREEKFIVPILIIYLPTQFLMSQKGLARYAIPVNNFVAYWPCCKLCSGLC